MPPDEPVRQPHAQGLVPALGDLAPIPAAPVPARRIECSSRTRSHKGALQLYHKKACVRDSLLGDLKGSPISGAYWAKVKVAMI